MNFFKIFSKQKINITISSTYHDGFNFSYIADEYSAIRNNNYYIGTIQRYFKILKESEKLINTTSKPNIFFERYLICIAILNDLILIEKKLSFKTDNPSKLKKKIQEKEVFTVNDFLDRYYQETLSKIEMLKSSKAIQNKITTFSNEIDKYSKYMSNESLKKFTIMYENLENKYLK